MTSVTKSTLLTAVIPGREANNHSKCRQQAAVAPKAEYRRSDSLASRDLSRAKSNFGGVFAKILRNKDNVSRLKH